MALISFNRHYPHKVDHEWDHSVPLNPAKCLDQVTFWLRSLPLDKAEIHDLVVPAVRSDLVQMAYHAVFGHFPWVWHAVRGVDRYNWYRTDLQGWRNQTRSNGKGVISR